jgi:hypothetical protein
VSPLADLLRHPFGAVRRRAAQVLHRMTIPEARAALDVAAAEGVWIPLLQWEIDEAKAQDAENQ